MAPSTAGCSTARAFACDELSDLSAIIETQRELAGAGPDLQRVVALIVERTQALTCADGAVVELCEDDALVYRFACGSATSFLGLRIPIHGSLSGACIRSGELLVCHDIEVDRRVNLEIARQVGLRAMIVVPLKSQGRVFGVLKVMADRPGAFAQRDVRTLQLMAEFIGAAMGQALDHHARQTLLLHASQLAAIVEGSSDAIYGVTMGGIVTSWNPGAEKLFGYSADEAIGQDVAFLIPREHCHEAEAALQAVLEGRLSVPYETTRLRKGGARLEVSLGVSPILGPDGAVIGLSVIARDISERLQTRALLESQAEQLRRQNEELQRRQRQLEALNADLERQREATEELVEIRTRDLARQRNIFAGLLEHLPGGLAMLDEHLVFQLANPTYARALNLRQEDFVGRHIYEVFPGTEAQIDALLRRVLDHGEAVTQYGFRFVYDSPEGPRESHWDFTYAPVFGPDGRVEGLLALCYEVTPRVLLERQVESSMRQTEQEHAMLEAILHHVPAGVALLGPDYHFRWVNAQAARMHHRTCGEMAGQSLYAMSPLFPSPNPGLERAFAGEVFEGRSLPLHYLEEGTERLGYFDSSYVPVRDGEGAVVGVLMASVDVTARVEAEQIQDRQLAALRQAAALKDEFIAVASHELRTPLAAIRSAGAILAKGRAGALSPDQARFAEMILAQADRLGRLVNDLLDLQRLESGAMPYRLIVEDVRPLLVQVADAFRPMAEGRTFELALADGPLVANFDADRLAQVLLNLLANAARFTPERGHITLSASRRSDELHIAVADTGVGIPLVDLERVFDKFVQVDNSITRRTGGSGLGLSIARRIVEDGHQGKLEVTSRVGEGSCFTVVLPGR